MHPRVLIINLQDPSIHLVTKHKTLSRVHENQSLPDAIEIYSSTTTSYIPVITLIKLIPGKDFGRAETQK